MRKGSIYKIYCLCSDKVYIGQTVQHPPIRRWIDHYKDINRTSNELYLYRAFRKWGIENFTFQIVEQDIDIRELDKKEQEWIKKYEANNPEKGYNLTLGGVMTRRSVIDETIAKRIIEDIKNKKDMTFVELAGFYGVSREIISDINCGETWYFSDETYPIRDNSLNKNILSKNDVYAIYELLKKEISLTDIAKQYHVSVTNISNINKGIIYKYLSPDSYPINIPSNSKKWLDKEKVKNIIILLQTTDYIYAHIGEIVGVGRKTVSGINHGILYRQMSEENGIITFPIR